jgi:CDP-4-dehydro-6-deoxyglucose reductase
MPYTIEVQPSGARFSAEAGESILDAALRNGRVFPYGCRSGSCASCKGKILQGEIHYPDETLDGFGKIDRAAGEALFCQAQPCGDLVIEVREIERAEGVEIRRLPCRVVKLEQLAPDVMRVFLKLPDKERLRFLAGQYIDFLLRDGRHRSFSLANPPHDDELLELHIRHVPNGEFTGHVFNKMREKDLLRLEGPLGTFFLREDSDRPMIFVAGGTGFAPIKSILLHCFARGIARPMRLYWGARSRQDLYLHDLAQSWAAQYPHFQYIPVLSDPKPEDAWAGRTGFVHDTVLQDVADFSSYQVYTCGPPIMIDSIRKSFLPRGLDEAHLFYDSFEFAADRR